MTAKPNPKSTQRKPKAEMSPSWQPINLNAAGIDIGSETHWVSVPLDRDEKSVRPFGCFTADLYALADWLQACGIETVAMESTGVYWIPIFQILETRGFEVKLVNAHHVKTLPGRKSDVLESYNFMKFIRLRSEQSMSKSSNA